MFKNYFKLAIKVLGRRRFFTFVSLFGISFTLMILMLIMAFLDTELGANAPMSQADRMVFADRLEMQKQYYDTLWTLDSSLVDGQMQIDTSGFELESDGSSNSISSVGYRVFNELLSEIPEAENMTFMYHETYDVFHNGKKLPMGALHTTASYWDILDFEFVAGRPFQAAEDEQAKSVLVITDHMAKQYFGTTDGVIGRTLSLSGRQYEVLGLVARSRSSSSFTQADIFLPLHTGSSQKIDPKGLQGACHAIYLAPTAKQQTALRDALDYAGRQLPIPPDQDYDEVRLYVFTPWEKYAYDIFGEEDTAKGLLRFRLVLFGMLGFFILIPTLNLINLNLSRMMERAAEIGVRKSFGASSSHILGQFLFENIVVTLLGGCIGLILAFGLIFLINSSQVLPNTELAFNWRVFAYSFLLCLFFGLLSGLLPAWRMSRLPVVQGLQA